MPPDAPPALALSHVSMAFTKRSGDPLPVLIDIDLELRDGEILGLLGRSGCGKSTLLRIAAGLIAPTAGKALYKGREIDAPPEGLALVFQTFALMPWLTVRQNVEAALDAVGAAPTSAATRAQAAIDLIGLGGFESAYPRELSGGMRQRVGFARAMAIRPTVLLMDEPFSALDVLTAETLRTEFIDLWKGGALPTRAVMMVTHNIEEAVLLCDRVIVLANPGRIAAAVPIPLAYPRDRQDPALREIVDTLYATLTARGVRNGKDQAGAMDVLPEARPPDLMHLAEALAQATDGAADLSELAARAHSRGLGPARVMAAAEAMHMLAFAEMSDGRLKLAPAGRVFAEADRDGRKRLFREHLSRFVPLAAHIAAVLMARDDHTAPRTRFESELEDHCSKAAATATLRTAIAWGRFAELYAYDDRRRRFTAA